MTGVLLGEEGTFDWPYGAEQDLGSPVSFWTGHF
jgi:hypothetical protein